MSEVPLYIPANPPDGTCTGFSTYNGNHWRHGKIGAYRTRTRETFSRQKAVCEYLCAKGT